MSMFAAPPRLLRPVKWEYLPLENPARSAGDDHGVVSCLSLSKR
jgi:hypothetical protein